MNIEQLFAAGTMTADLPQNGWRASWCGVLVLLGAALWGLIGLTIWLLVEAMP